MNKYYWWGIDSDGFDKKGILFANSQENLKNILLKQNIALLKYKIYTQNFSKFLSFNSKISLQQKAALFYQLSVLINSNIELLKALELVEKQIKNKKLKNSVKQIVLNVSNGQSLSSSMALDNNIFSPFMVSIIKSGEDTGKLGFALQNLSDSLNSSLILKKNLIDAALFPIITLIFALFIILGLFVFVIPQFADFFASLDKPLPSSTKFIIKLSNFFCSLNIFWVLAIFVCLYILIKFLFQINKLKYVKDKILLKIYFLGKIYLYYDLVSFLQIISNLISTGVPLKQALELSINSIKNTFLKEKIILVTNLVTQGKSLYDALFISGENIFPQDLFAIVSVGENSGNLALMLERASKILQDDLNKTLKFITTLLQPILMLIIGLLIVFLLISVYLPIFNLANLV
ncbi:type II secretion system F family protein [Candidatus Babeliales bacterium]|nr:type II secretion system F family protein [Candidatus Babeliales bacterium]MCF7899695.1 type II secretion system F family protein [Candidatus Babeliales bacterium]